MPPHRTGSFAQGMQYTGIGVTFMVEAGVISGLGWWADRSWGTGPWLLVLGLLSGVTLATFSLVKNISAMERRKRNDH